jgi:aspartate aminotransferase
MKFADRVCRISISPTVAVMQEAQELRRKGVDVIDLGPGEPDFATPDSVKQAGIEAIRADFTKYTASSGILELREAVAASFNRDWSGGFSADNVLITSGAKHAVFSVCMTVFQRGDEVLVPAPYWVTFPECVRLADARPIELPTAEADGFELKAGQAAAACGPGVRGAIVNTPHNPTGAVYPRSTMEELAELSLKRGVFVLCDETYNHFTYPPREHLSLAAFVKASDTGYAIVGAVSKTFAMTGWRIGYVVGHRDLIGKLGEFQSHQTGNPCSVSQKAAVAALTSDLPETRAMKREYQQRREFVIEALARTPGFRCGQPNGAFYAFPNVEQCLRSRALESSEDLARFLLREAKVAVVPGSAFGLEGYIRLSYAASMEKLREGLRRIRETLSTPLESSAAQP